jgi:sugar phosphate isomerase/epimerase
MKQVSRRRVLKLGIAAAAIAAALPRQIFAKSLAKSTGIQLYTVSAELAENLPGTLTKIAAIGYRQVESAGLAGKTAQEFRKALDDAGLKCPSTHLFPAPGQSSQQYLEYANILGSRYVVGSVQFKPDAQLKSIDDYIRAIKALTQDDYKRMAADINTLATQARAAGLQFAYHNHNMEFHKWPDGVTSYEMLVAGTDPSLVKLELDCGWADLAGQSPLELFDKYPGRYRMLHIKDFKAPPHPLTELDLKAMPEPTELGKGHMDYKPILAAAPVQGIEQIFVEQEPPFVHFTALEAAKVDFNYLQSIG